MSRSPRPISRQARWQIANRLVGLCGCGRPRWKPRNRKTNPRKYAQCRKCILRDRDRRGYGDHRGKKGGRPPGPMGREKWSWEREEGAES